MDISPGIISSIVEKYAENEVMIDNNTDEDQIYQTEEKRLDKEWGMVFNRSYTSLFCTKGI